MNTSLKRSSGLSQIQHLLHKASGSYSLLFVTVVLIYYCALLSVPVELSRDSYGYISIAENIHSDMLTLRPIGYPLLIKLSMLIHSQYWKEVLVFIQVVFMALNALMIFNILQLFNIRNGIVFLVTLFVICSPAVITYSNAVLADNFISFCSTALWFIVIRYLYSDRQNNMLIPVLIGLLSGFTCLIKPVWMMGGFAVACVVFILMFRNKHPDRFLYPAVMLVGHFSVFFFWHYYSAHVLKQMNIVPKGDAGTMNINLGCMYFGLTRYGEGTPLYQHLDSVNYLDKALVYHYKTGSYPDFKALKRASGDVLGDPEFSRQVMQRAGVEYLKIKVLHYHKFFTTRMGGFAFINAPKSIRYLYQTSYDHFVRPVLPLLLLIAVCYVPFIRQYPVIYLTSFMIILYYSLVMTFYVCLPHEFSRIRIVADPVLFITALIPVVLLLKKYFPYLVLKPQQNLHHS